MEEVITDAEIRFLRNLLEGRDKWGDKNLSKYRIRYLMGHGYSPTTQSLLAKLISMGYVSKLNLHSREKDKKFGKSVDAYKVEFTKLFHKVFVPSDYFKRFEAVCNKYGVQFIR